MGRFCMNSGRAIGEAQRSSSGGGGGGGEADGESGERGVLRRLCLLLRNGAAEYGWKGREGSPLTETATPESEDGRMTCVLASNGFGRRALRG